MRRRRRAPHEGPPIERAPTGEYTTINLEYPIRPRARWGSGRPRHPELLRIIGADRERYRSVAAGILDHRKCLESIPLDAGRDPTAPWWKNDWCSGLDAASLHAFVARDRPATFLEVGSGMSTRFVRHAITQHEAPTRIVSIDPSPRVEVDALCDEVVRSAVEDVDLEVFDQLAAGDVLFVDNSHRVFQNSDATVMFLEVLPRLAGGVLVGFHDIYLPDDYAPEWLERFYSEQYVLAAYVLAEGPRYEIEFPAWFVSTDHELQTVLDDMWECIPGVERHGLGFWMRVR